MNDIVDNKSYLFWSNGIMKFRENTGKVYPFSNSIWKTYIIWQKLIISGLRLLFRQMWRFLRAFDEWECIIYQLDAAAWVICTVFPTVWNFMMKAKSAIPPNRRLTLMTSHGSPIQMNKFNFKQNRTNFAFRTCGFWVINKPNLKITNISYTHTSINNIKYENEIKLKFMWFFAIFFPIP